MIKNLTLDDISQQPMAGNNSAEVGTAKPAWFRTTARYGQADFGKSIWQSVNTFGLYGLLWALMIFTVKSAYPYWITLALAVLAGGILVRVFILFHDCCHGSFFASHRANSILGRIAGVLTFTPFEDWRHKHNRHHATAGDLDRRGIGDIWTMTTAEYMAASLWQRFSYRLYRNPFILLGPGSVLLFLCLNRFPSKGGGNRERKSVAYTNLALLFIVGISSWTIGLTAYLLIQLPIIVIAGGLGLWLFYIQHQFEDVYWEHRESWDSVRVALEGSSYFKLPKILQWFTGNIGLHHVHHVRPSIPNYNLQRCHDEIPAFQAVKAITLMTSFRSLQLSLCDPENQKLVSFRSLSARRRCGNYQ